jgi:hypothetical protein
MRRVDIGRPLIAAGVEKAGGLISQQYLHTSKQAATRRTGQQPHHHEISVPQSFG